MTVRKSTAASPNLTWPEIRANAARFAREWAHDTSERAEAQTFWNEFFAVFGVQRRPNPVHAHQVLDRAVDAAYRADGGARTYAGDAERVAFLFKRYAELTSIV